MNILLIFEVIFFCQSLISSLDISFEELNK